MPTLHFIPLREKMHALALIDGGKETLRKTSNLTGVPKSTLHDNLPKYRSEIERFEKAEQQLERDLVKDILLISIEGKVSSRSSADILSKQKGRHISHQKILSVLAKMGDIAQAKNSEPFLIGAICNGGSPLLAPLSTIKCGAFDEIFQKKLPILGFVDPVSAFIFIEDAPNRSEASWNNFLEKLKNMGLDPESTVTDGGKGMLKSIGKIFPEALRIRDLFHVLQKLSKGLKALEGYCYRLIIAYDKLEKKFQCDGKKSSLYLKMDMAIQIYDALNDEVTLFRKGSYFENNSGYVTSKKIKIIMERIVAMIDCASRNNITHRALKAASSYLKGAKDDIAAYKATIEKMVETHYGDISFDAVLGYICPIIECLDQIQRSYENLKRKGFWEDKVKKYRKRFREFSFIDQDEVDRAIDLIAKEMGRVKKSNSMIENVNGVIRRFLTTYQSIPSWFCPLFTFYWNHRRFKRGKRKGLKPIEVLTRAYNDSDWIDELLEGYVFKDEKAEPISND